MQSLTLSVDIAVPQDDVMAYASDPRHLPEWATGFALGVKPDGDAWQVQTPQGIVKVWFTPPNADGILDHTVRLPQGIEIINRMRVMPCGTGSRVTFELCEHEGMTEEQFDEDANLVQADLERLKSVLED